MMLAAHLLPSPHPSLSFRQVLIPSSSPSLHLYPGTGCLYTMKLAPIVAVAITLVSSGLVSAAPIENRGASNTSSHVSHSKSKSSSAGGPFKTSSRNRYPAYGIGDGTGSFGGPMNLQGSGKDSPESSRVSGPHRKNRHSKGAKHSATEHYSNADIKDQIPSESELKEIGRQRFLSKMKQGMGLDSQQTASLLNILAGPSSTQGSHHSTKPTSSAHDRSILTGVTHSSTAHSSESVKGHAKSNGKSKSLADVDPGFAMTTLGKAHKSHKSKSHHHHHHNHHHSSEPSSSTTSQPTSSSASPSTHEESDSHVKAAQGEPSHTATTQSTAQTQGLQKRSMQKRRRCHKKKKSSHDSSSSSPSSSHSKSSHKSSHSKSSSPSSSHSKSSHKSKHSKSSSPTSSSSSTSKSSPDNKAHSSSKSTTSTGPHGKVQSASSSSDVNYVDDGSKSGSDVSGSGSSNILRDFGLGRDAQQSNDKSENHDSGSSNNNNPFYAIPF